MEQRFVTSNTVNAAPDLPGFSWMFEPGLDRAEQSSLAGPDIERKDSSSQVGLVSLNVPPTQQQLQQPQQPPQQPQRVHPYYQNHQHHHQHQHQHQHQHHSEHHFQHQQPLSSADVLPASTPVQGASRLNPDGASTASAAAAAVATAAGVDAGAAAPQRVEASAAVDPLGVREAHIGPLTTGPGVDPSAVDGHAECDPARRLANHGPEVDGSIGDAKRATFDRKDSLSSSLSSRESRGSNNSSDATSISSISSYNNTYDGPYGTSVPHFMPSVEYTAGLAYSAGSMAGFGGAVAASMPPLAHIPPGYSQALNPSLNSLGPMQMVQSYGAPPPPVSDNYAMAMGGQYVEEDGSNMALGHPPQRDMRSSAYGSQLKRCPICQKVLRRDLTRHMRIHEAVAEFRCPFPREKCNHKRGQFNRPYEYKKHLMNSHFIFNDPEESRNAPNLQERLRLEGQCHCGAGEMTVDDWIVRHIGSRECPLLPQSRPHSPQE